MLNSIDPDEMAYEPSHMNVQCILSVIEKLLASKFRYFGKYIILAMATFTFMFRVNNRLV